MKFTLEAIQPDISFQQGLGQLIGSAAKIRTAAGDIAATITGIQLDDGTTISPEAKKTNSRPHIGSETSAIAAAPRGDLIPAHIDP